MATELNYQRGTALAQFDGDNSLRSARNNGKKLVRRRRWEQKASQEMSWRKRLQKQQVPDTQWLHDRNAARQLLLPPRMLITHFLRWAHKC